MKNKKAILLSSLLSGIILFSCGSKSEKTDIVETSNQELSFVEIDSSQINSLNDLMGMETIEFTSEKGAGRRKDKMWRVWKRLYRSCMSNDMIEKDPVYFGPTNDQIKIGHILNYNTNKKKFVPVCALIMDRLSKEEKQLLCGSDLCRGSLGNCTESFTIQTDGSFLVNMGFTANLAEGNLQMAVSTAKSVESSVEGFEHVIVNSGSLSDVMSTQDSDFKKNYFKWASKPQHLLVNSMIRAKGFKSTITTSIDISGELEARLKAPEGVVQKIANTEIEIKYSYISKRQISLSVNSSFVVFGGIISSGEYFSIGE